MCTWGRKSRRQPNTMSGNLQAIRRNSKEEPMETDGTIGSYQKIAETSKHKRPRVDNDGTLGLGAANQEDIQTDMQTDRPDGTVVADPHAKTSSDSLHSQLLTFLRLNLVTAMTHYRSFLTNVGSHLDNYDLQEAKEDISDILQALEKQDKIGKGNYNVLLQVLKDAKLILLMKQVESRQKSIHEAMEAEGQAIPPEYKAPVDEMNCARLHCLLKEDIHGNLVPQMKEYASFLNSVKVHLPKGRVTNNQESVVDIIDMLEERGIIGMGKYDKLEESLASCGLNALQTKVADWGHVIRQAMEQEGISVTSDIQAPTSRTENSDRQYSALFDYIGENVNPNEYKSFLTIVRGLYLTQGEVETCKNVDEIMQALELKNIFCKGDYSNLIKILEGSHLNSLSAKVENMQIEIKKKMLEDGLSLPDPKQESEADKILMMHNSLFVDVNQELSPAMHEYKSFLTMARSYMPGGVLEENKESVSDILRALQINECIAVGNYTVFLNILDGSSLQTLKIKVKKKQEEIQNAMKKDGRRIPELKKAICGIREPRTSEQQHRDLFNHINNELHPKTSDYGSFLTAVKSYLPAGSLAANKQSATNILDELQSKKIIQKGDYSALLRILECSKLLRLRGEVEKKEAEIQQTMTREGDSTESVTTEVPESEQLHRQLLEEVHRQLSPKSPEYNSFKRNVDIYTKDKGAIAKSKNTAELLAALETANKLGVGNYETLLTALRDSRLMNLEKHVRSVQQGINAALEREHPNLKKRKGCDTLS